MKLLGNMSGDSNSLVTLQVMRQLEVSLSWHEPLGFNAVKTSNLII